MKPLRHAVLALLTLPGMRSALRPARSGAGSIFMLHRLSDPETGAVGHDPAELRETVALLRKRGYDLVDLGEMFRRLREGAPQADLGVAFTIDDGYAEQVRVAGPIFAEFDCPATICLTTGFLDKALWMWWDRVAFAFDGCRARRIITTIAGTALEYQWEPGQGPGTAIVDFVARCKLVPEEERLAAIDRLAAAAGVELPADPPERYAPMTWAEARHWEDRGISFAPHTVTHPILSRTSDEQSRQEIAGSWNRLSEMLRRPLPLFCYPNGLRDDFGPREVETVRSLGFQGALATTPGYAETTAFRSNLDGPFRVRRLHYPDSVGLAAGFVIGVGRLKYRSEDSG